MAGGWVFPKTKESNVIFADNVNISTAKVTITGSGSDIRFFLGLCDTWDGTYTYEEVSSISGDTHTFTATGKFLKWKAVGSDYTITKIEIEVNP